MTASIDITYVNWQQSGSRKATDMIPVGEYAGESITLMAYDSGWNLLNYYVQFFDQSSERIGGSTYSSGKYTKIPSGCVSLTITLDDKQYYSVIIYIGLSYTLPIDTQITVKNKFLISEGSAKRTQYSYSVRQDGSGNWTVSRNESVERGD